MTYNMEAYLKQLVKDCVDLISGIFGPKIELVTIPSPFLKESCSQAEARAPKHQGLPAVDSIVPTVDIPSHQMKVPQPLLN